MPVLRCRLWAGIVLMPAWWGSWARWSPGAAGGVTAAVAQPRLRVLLGLLGVAAGRVVGAEALVDGVWGSSGRRAGSRICMRCCISCGGGWPPWNQE